MCEIAYRRVVAGIPRVRRIDLDVTKARLGLISAERRSLRSAVAPRGGKLDMDGVGQFITGYVVASFANVGAEAQMRQRCADCQFHSMWQSCVDQLNGPHGSGSILGGRRGDYPDCRHNLVAVDGGKHGLIEIHRDNLLSNSIGDSAVPDFGLATLANHNRQRYRQVFLNPINGVANGEGVEP